MGDDRRVAQGDRLSALDTSAIAELTARAGLPFPPRRRSRAARPARVPA